MKAIVKLTIIIPATEATPQEIDEWIEFELGYSPSMSRTNPLLNESLEIEKCSIDQRP
jgi:hypothetical protein